YARFGYWRSALPRCPAGLEVPTAWTPAHVGRPATGVRWGRADRAGFRARTAGRPSDLSLPRTRRAPLPAAPSSNIKCSSKCPTPSSLQLLAYTGTQPEKLEFDLYPKRWRPKRGP